MNPTEFLVKFPTDAPAPLQFASAMFELMNMFIANGLTWKEARKVLEFHISLIEDRP